MAARVRPFRAWRYNRPDVDITPVCAPPYDVIDASQREELLAMDDHNVVALELPDGPLDSSLPGNRYETGERLWDEWRATGVLAQDADPALYVLEQRFTLDGKPVRRRAFIAEVGLEPFDAGIVIPHERTLPKALGDRFELIKATGANLSQVFGLFDDESCETDDLFETVMANPPIERAVDADGVESVLWMSTDATIASRLTTFMSDRRIFIADGHHRYTVALAHRDLRRATAGATEDTGMPYEGVMMALVNMDDPDLAVLPYHRMADASGEFDSASFIDALHEYFDVTALTSSDSHALDGEERVSFLIQMRGQDHPHLVVLRDDVDLDAAINREHSMAWKSLDVAVLQELILWPLLGIHPDHPETLDRISFTKNAVQCLSSPRDVSIVLRPTRLSQLREVSLAGETMPQKSTYFYPKLLSGLVFRSAE